MILILVVYGNTFNASWHLDDRTNILDNKNVHVSSLSLNDWSRSVLPPFSSPVNGQPGLSNLYRPVAMVTFALNWFLGGADVFGYHLVNIGLHCTTSVLLFFTSLVLLDTPNTNSRYRTNRYFIASLATALWGLHPIHTQAVTYIVQRMAVLAAFFYLCGVFFYVKARSTLFLRKRALFFGLAGLSYVMAMGSKQNAVTMPLACLLVELVFYRSPGFWKNSRARWAVLGILTAFIAFFIIVLFYWRADPLNAILEGYTKRPFTLTERVLTEFRVLIFYLGQLFYPIPQQFSIMHDFKISTSMVTPITTLGAAMLVAMLTGGALLYARKWPVLSFAILFFFLGHAVESSIFALELVFEHRNYLPSLFLFLPVASGITILIDRYRCKNRLIYISLVGSIILIVLGISLGTHIRNSVWRDEKSLWRDAMQKAPSLARPYQNLALALEREGKLDVALRLNKKALELEDPHPYLSRFISLSNIGNIHRKKGDYLQAIHYLTEAVNIEKGPYKQRARLNLVLCLLNAQEEGRALEHVDDGLRQQPGNIRLLTVKGFILSRQGHADKALAIFQQVIKQNPYDRDGLINLAMVLSSKGFHQRSEWFLRMAMQRYPNNLIIHLGLLQNALAMKDLQRANHYMAGISEKFSMDDINRFLVARNRGMLYINSTQVSIDHKIVIPSLIDYLEYEVSILNK